MKTNKKKVLSILTAFIMAFTVFGCTGWAFAEEATGDEPEVQTMGEPASDAIDEPEAEAETPDEVTEPEGDDATVELLNMDPTGEVSDKSILLSWTAEEPATAGWTVYYVLNGGPLSDVETSETSYNVTGLKPHTTYTFTIQAWEKDPEGVQESRTIGEEQVTLTTDCIKPATPKKKSSKSTVTTLSFTWSAVKAQNKGKISYKIYESKDGKPIKTLTATTWKKTGLTQRGSLSHTYYIKAVEKLSDGTVVESAFGTLKASLKDFKEQKLKGLVSDPGYKAVLLQWNKMDGAKGYKIYWRQGGERGNIDTVGRDSDGHWMKTFRSKKTKKYVMPKKPGKYKYLAEVKQPANDDIVTFDKRGLDIMNHTYVYFYQFMIVPYYDDDDGAPIYTKQAPKDAYKSSALNKTTQKVAGMSDLKHNIVRNNTVLPMYVYEKAKYNKPIYKTHKMSDGKKRGRLHKGHAFICWDKANGRVKFYGKKDGSGQPDDTFWFAQKNARTIQGYYMDNCRYGGKTDLKRKDWKTGYSKKTVLDYVNHCGINSKTNYFVWASKYAQHVYILKKDSDGKWALLDGGKDRLPTNTKGCWSNLCASGKVNIQSRNGHYIIFGKQYKANRSAYDYFCLSKLHKTVRLHSLLYKNGKKFSSFKFHNKVLGNPISKGCIRMRPYAAQWLYKHVPKKTRTLVY